MLNLAAELGNVSHACKVMGFSRDTFYRYQAAVEAGGVEALIDANRRKPNIKNRVEEAMEAAVTAFALEQPVELSPLDGHIMFCLKEKKYDTNL